MSVYVLSDGEGCMYAVCATLDVAKSNPLVANCEWRWNGSYWTSGWYDILEVTVEEAVSDAAS